MKCPQCLFHILLLILTFPQHHSISVYCCSFRRAGENAAREISWSVSTASKDINLALDSSSQRLTSSINQAVRELDSILKTTSSELRGSIRDASRDLSKVILKITDSVDKGVAEVSGVLREGIDATKVITNRLSSSMDNAVEELGSQVEFTVKTVKEVIGTLSQSVDKGVAELGRTLRYVADRMVDVAKQVNIRMDSGDLVDVSNITKEALVQSVSELTTNWKVAVDTMDFRDIGKGAAAELSAALQNLKAHIKLDVGIDDNLRDAILYISVAVGVAFSVLFVAIVVSLRGCSSCMGRLFSLAFGERDLNSTGSGNRQTRTDRPVKFHNVRRDGNKKTVSKTTKEPQQRHFDFIDLSDSDDGIQCDIEVGGVGGAGEGSGRSTFDKTQTLSLAGFTNFSEIRKKFEQGKLQL